jgi:hypothetical protein
LCEGWLATAAGSDNLNLLPDPKFSPALTIQRFNLSTIHQATAHVLLRDISKILFPYNPVNVPIIKINEQWRTAEVRFSVSTPRSRMEPRGHERHRWENRQVEWSVWEKRHRR